MKNLFFWMVLIGSIFAILGSCAKDDDSAATTTTTSKTTTTPSGSITMGNYTLSGVYLTECQTSGVSTFIALGAFPSDVKSYGFAFVVTGDDNITTETHTFTDTGCTTSSYINKLVRDNVTVGTASGANYPLTYNATGFKWTVNTTTAETFLENLYSSINLDMTVGTEKFVASTGSLAYNLVTPGDTTIYLGSESSSATPSTVGAQVYTK
ncbi:uncharacterized protein METZ01_LOCUS462699, partial [marine metagenome]